MQSRYGEIPCQRSTNSILENYVQEIVPKPFQSLVIDSKRATRALTSTRTSLLPKDYLKYALVAIGFQVHGHPCFHVDEGAGLYMHHDFCISGSMSFYSRWAYPRFVPNCSFSFIYLIHLSWSCMPTIFSLQEVIKNPFWGVMRLNLPVSYWMDRYRMTGTKQWMTSSTTITLFIQFRSPRSKIKYHAGS